MLLSCKPETKQKDTKTQCNWCRVVPTPMPPFFDPLYLFSFTSDLYSESRFVIPSLSSTKLDDGGGGGGGGPYSFSCPPPPPRPPPRIIHIRNAFHSQRPSQKD